MSLTELKVSKFQVSIIRLIIVDTIYLRLLSLVSFALLKCLPSSVLQHQPDAHSADEPVVEICSETPRHRRYMFIHVITFGTASDVPFQMPIEIILEISTIVYTVPIMLV